MSRNPDRCPGVSCLMQMNQHQANALRMLMSVLGCDEPDSQDVNMARLAFALQTHGDNPEERIDAEQAREWRHHLAEVMKGLDAWHDEVQNHIDAAVVEAAKRGPQA